MALAELQNGRIEFTSEFREKELVKQLPGAKWDKDNRVWWVPLSWAACVQARGVFGIDLQVGPALTIWAEEELATRIAPSLELRQADDGPEVAHFPLLYPYQRAGVWFLSNAKRALLADEMGTGKTLQLIATVQNLNAWPALFVVPNTTKFTWAKEFEKWAPWVSVFVIDGSAAVRRKQITAAAEAAQAGQAVAVIINWEGLRGHSRISGYGDIRLDDKDKELKELNTQLQFRAIIGDEAHRAKNPRAKQTRAFWYVAHHGWCGDMAPVIIVSTGTPIANAPEDLWALMHAVAPDEWPAKTRFIDRYALLSWNNFGGMDTVGIRPEMRDELFRILDPRFIRRLKVEVLKDLPPKIYTQRIVQLGTKQRKAYEQIRKEMLAELDGGFLMASNPLAKLTRLLQFASAYGEIDEEGNLRMTEPSCKVDAMMDIAEDLGDKPAGVFAESRQLIELTATRMVKAGYKIGQITGAVSPQERANNVQAFQEGRLQFLLLTLGAGGEGITLTAADTAVMLQRSFNEVKNKQAEDRFHRPGAEGHDAINIIDVVSDDTAEELIVVARIMKSMMADEITRDPEVLRRLLT